MPPDPQYPETECSRCKGFVNSSTGACEDSACKSYGKFAVGALPSPPKKATKRELSKLAAAAKTAAATLAAAQAALVVAEKKQGKSAPQKKAFAAERASAKATRDAAQLASDTAAAALSSAETPSTVVTPCPYCDDATESPVAHFYMCINSACVLRGVTIPEANIAKMRASRPTVSTAGTADVGRAAGAESRPRVRHRGRPHGRCHRGHDRQGG